jgi:hypothetical protein
VNGALILAGSPRGPRSSSAALGRCLIERLAGRGIRGRMVLLYPALRSQAKSLEVLGAVQGAGLVVLTAPLYWDSLPAGAIESLERIAARRRVVRPPAGQRFAAILNSGFPEQRQSVTALAICRQFATEAGFTWAGGLAIGCGEALGGRRPEDAGHLGRRLAAALDVAAAGLAGGGAIPAEASELLAAPLVPRWGYLLLGGIMWRLKSARRRVLRLGARPYQTP